MELKDLNINQNWTLFLDRDGVINKKLDNDYVKNVDEFDFLDGAVETVAHFSKLFNRILVVTNQQGIGKGLMTKEDLQEVHDYMLAEVVTAGGKIDRVYYCPDLAEKNTKCRKPNTGMAEKAKADYRDIDFKKSIMVGDSLSDIQMGKRLGMYTVFISESNTSLKEADITLGSLKEMFEKLQC